MKKFTKILYKGEKLTLEWTEEVLGESNTYSLKTKSEPHPDFLDILRSMDKCVAVEAELPLSDDEYKRHDVQGVVMKYEEDQYGSSIMSASLVSERFMAQADESMAIKSPMKPETADAGIPLGLKTVEVIYLLMAEAEHFLEGKRLDLFHQP